jgi:hypothetical protein
MVEDAIEKIKPSTPAWSLPRPAYTGQEWW